MLLRGLLELIQQGDTDGLFLSEKYKYTHVVLSACICPNILV